MPKATIYIAERGAKLQDGEPSQVGHMWYSLDDGSGKELSFGFAPAKHGSPFGPGKVYDNDSANYINKYYSRTVEISQDQYDRMLAFGKDPTSVDFSSHYNGSTNSCIDFTWKAMEVGGMNPKGYEGRVWPTWNKGRVEAALDAFEAKQTLRMTVPPSKPAALSSGGGGGAGKPQARQTDLHVCPMVTGLVPHVGGPISGPCATTVLVGGLPAARVTDMASCVGPPDAIAAGSANVFVEGLAAARMGDPSVHGGTIVIGIPTVLTGG